MTREQLFESNRDNGKYQDLTIESECLVPLTADGFEDLVQAAAAYSNLPVDDGARLALIGYLHSIPNTEMKFDFRFAVATVYNSYSKNVTYIEMQKAKGRMSEEVRRLQEKEKAAAEGQANPSPLKLVKDNEQEGIS